MTVLSSRGVQGAVYAADPGTNEQGARVRTPCLILARARFGERRRPRCRDYGWARLQLGISFPFVSPGAWSFAKKYRGSPLYVTCTVPSSRVNVPSSPVRPGPAVNVWSAV